MTATRKINLINGVVTTSDAATTTTVCSYTVPTGAVVLVEGTLVGRDSVSGDGASANISHRFKNVSGVLSAVSTAVSFVSFAAGSDVSLATSVITLDASGTSVRLRVNGIISLSIDWFGEMKIYVN